MSRGATIAAIVAGAVLVALLVTVNVTRCDTFSGPLGLFRITACEQEPLVNPPD